MLSDISQTQKDKYCQFPWSIKTKGRIVVTRDYGERAMSYFLMGLYRVYVWGNKEVLEMHSSDDYCTTL